MKTLFYFLRFIFSKKSTFKSYLQMREDYVNSNFFKIVIFINKIFNRKHKISVSNGVLGQLADKELKEVIEKIKVDGYFIFNKKIDLDKVSLLIFFVRYCIFLYASNL